MTARWEHFSHGADIGVLGYGRTTAEAFEQAALAMTAIVIEPARVGTAIAHNTDCEAPDLELLLVDWLNALIYAIATRHLLFGRYAVRIDGTRLHATAWGERLNIRHHAPAVELKGATLTALDVSRNAEGCWRAGCVIDV